MTSDVQQCVFVVSHPRSGTHLLIDFVRRNFPAFNPKLMPWQSASNLYLNVDLADWQRQALACLRARRSHVLLKSHFAGYLRDTDCVARRVLNPRSAVFLYPFRKFSSVVKSFAEFRHMPPPISTMLTQRDRFFNQEMTVGGCLRAHVESWIERDACFVDCDALRDDPETACARLAAVLEQSPAEISRRLPRRKYFAGKGGELIERLSGRQSTEVVVDYELSWQSRDEEMSVDEEFHDLYSELLRRRINDRGGSIPSRAKAI